MRSGAEHLLEVELGPVKVAAKSAEDRVESRFGGPALRRIRAGQLVTTPVPSLLGQGEEVGVPRAPPAIDQLFFLQQLPRTAGKLQPGRVIRRDVRIGGS